jgi:transposase
MRGKSQAQPQFLTVVNLNPQVPPDHPLRSMKRRAQAVLPRLSPLFNDLHAKEGRPGIPPEQLLKACLLIALFSVRSERLFCEQLGYDLLWLWFLDRALSEGSFDHSVFAKNKERVLSAEMAPLFFAEVYEMARQEKWTRMWPAAQGDSWKDWMGARWISPAVRPASGCASGLKRFSAGSKPWEVCGAALTWVWPGRRRSLTSWREPATCCAWSGWNRWPPRKRVPN